VGKLHRGLFSSLLPSRISGQHKGRLHKGPRRKPASRPVLSAVGVERLEDRWALSAVPALTYQGQSPDPAFEGSQVAVSFEFTDDVVGGAGAVGLDPTAYTSIGEFNTELWDTASSSDSIQSITVDTGIQNGVLPKLTVNYTNAIGLQQQVEFTGTFAERYTTGNPADEFEIAVFSFSSFNLGSGFTITAAGERPLALLSQDDMTIAGIVDASARFDAGPIAVLTTTNNQHAPGPGGGAGHRRSFVGDPGDGNAAAGAPMASAGFNPGYLSAASAVRARGRGRPTAILLSLSKAAVAAAAVSGALLTGPRAAAGAAALSSAPLVC
jgi:hypothetical protein